MYAILDIAGRQERVEKGSTFTVNRLARKEGSSAKFNEVIFAKKGAKCHVGKPYVKGASVECEVVSLNRAKKVIAFKYKRRKSYRRKIGHRQDLTTLKVTEMHIPE
ncbi:MAG: 50S ribosomal protein L21 [Candidatus Omnitrophota bacterium]